MNKQIFNILADWTLEVPLWWSAGGGTARILADTLQRHFDLSFNDAIKIVEQVQDCHEGFFWDAWDHGFRADARGFATWLTRQGWPAIHPFQWAHNACFLYDAEAGCHIYGNEFHCSGCTHYEPIDPEDF